VSDAYLYGAPTWQGQFKASPADFKVTEELALSVTDPQLQHGEHQWLWVKKVGANTTFVAAQLAKFAGVRERDVSFSGLKDRHAETYQWFSIQLPGKPLLPWHELQHPEFEVLQAVLQPRKLKRGTHSSNHFVLVLRDISQPEALQHRWEQIVAGGVPNYFGEQRFGHQQQNLVMAQRWFNGELKRRLQRNQIGLYLSAVRSKLFNMIVSERIKQQRLTPAIGDAMMLRGSQSFFVIEQLDDTTLERFKQGDIMVTAALPGEGQWPTQGNIAEFEQTVCAREPELYQGLLKQRIEHMRRPILLTLTQPQLRWLAHDTVELAFSLPRGSFATSVLRELIGEPRQGN